MIRESNSDIDVKMKSVTDEQPQQLESVVVKEREKKEGRSIVYKRIWNQTWHAYHHDIYDAILAAV